MKFEKVSLNQFIKDVKSCAPGLNDSDYELMYNALKIPKRATKGSAGYDFFAPFSFLFPTQQKAFSDLSLENKNTSSVLQCP